MLHSCLLPAPMSHPPSRPAGLPPSRRRAAVGSASNGEPSWQDGVGTPDGFQRLWMPHRMAYIKGENKPAETGGPDCPFCRIPSLPDAEALIVARGSLVYAVLNLYPYNSGHLMVCPYRHVADYTELDDAETAELAKLTRQAMRTLRAASGAQGFNIGMNMGGVAGAGHRRAPAPARGAPVGRRRQLHAGGRPDQGPAAAAGRYPRAAGRRVAGSPGRAAGRLASRAWRRPPPSRPGARAAAHNAGRSGRMSRCRATSTAGRSRSG